MGNKQLGDVGVHLKCFCFYCLIITDKSIHSFLTRYSAEMTTSLIIIYTIITTLRMRKSKFRMLKELRKENI